MRFLLPTGIGDSVWALHKIQGIAEKYKAKRIDIGLTCGLASTIESRALDFVKRFSFVDSVKMCPGFPILQEPFFREDGCWNYIADGFYEFGKERDKWCVLVPNEPLEHGIRLEEWLPDIPINWRIWDYFLIKDEERRSARRLTPPPFKYVVFYPGPLDGNTVQGHNRNMLWKPHDWIRLGQQIHLKYGLEIVVVGAPYDLSYYDTLLAPNLNGASGYWHNLIGKTTLGELFTITQSAKFVLSYQAGVGIVSTYLNTPTGIFWRPQGDSLLRDGYLSFDEKMASAWVPPRIMQNGRHLPLIYGKHDTHYILDEIQFRGWAK